MAAPTIRTPDQRLRVFISSTLQELAPERAAVRDAIVRLRLSPVAFESGARPYPPQELYRAYLEQSDLFVGIYWERYGWVAEDMDVSGLEDEYNLSASHPRLMYIKSPSPDREERLSALINRIRDSGVSYKYFSTPEELQELVENDLAVLLTERFAMAGGRPSVAEGAPPPPPPLPAQLTRFFGREAELAALRRLLTEDSAPIVTLVGPGGVGKTRLAIEAAAAVASHYPDGVWNVPLAPLTDPGLVIQAVAAELDVREAGDRSLADLVADRLRGKRSLLLLDNFEHVVDAAPAVAELAAVPGVQLLITSREPLHVRGERQLPVEPLSLAGGAESPESLASQAAVALFVDRARAAQPSFDLTPDNAHAVAEICRRLDGLPLAIELAAARASLVTPQALLERLEHALDLAVRGARDLPDRQRTLRSAIEYSYTLLPPEEQRFFAALSLFPGGATAESADAVWGDATSPALDMLESLSEKSLVRHELAPRGDVRFRMLRTIREYASERLAERSDGAELQSRRNAYFVEQLRVGGLRQFGAEHARWLGFAAEEYDNIRAVLEDVRNDPAALAVVVWGMQWSWYRRGLLSEGRYWCDAALAALQEPSPERGMILEAAGAITMWQGDLQLAQQRLEESAAVMREHGDPFFLPASIFVLGVAHIAQGHQAEAQPLLEEALARFREAGEKLAFWSALSLMHLGTIQLARGELARAREMLSQSLDESRRVGDPWVTASVLNNLGETARTQGDYQDAAGYYEESLREFEVAGARGDVARSMTTLAFTACRTGDLERARNALARATAVHRESGNKRGLAECLLGYAFVAASASRDGDTSLARRAVALVAAVDAEMEAIGARLWPADEPERAEALARATALLDDTAVATAREEGVRLSVTDALEQETSEAQVSGA